MADGSTAMRREELGERLKGVECADSENDPQTTVHQHGDDQAWLRRHLTPAVSHHPWGETVWVSEDDFVNGGMAKTSESRFPDVHTVHVPR